VLKKGPELLEKRRGTPRITKRYQRKNSPTGQGTVKKREKNFRLFFEPETKEAS